MSVFKDFNQVGVTTLVATHDEELMSRFAQRVFVIEPGRFRDFAVPAS
jgi:cell division transport system ATP-binding protein